MHTADTHRGQDPFLGFPRSHCLPLDMVSAETATSCPAQVRPGHVLADRAAFLSAHGKSVSPVVPAPEAS